jgi:hypothetical protein
MYFEPWSLSAVAPGKVSKECSDWGAGVFVAFSGVTKCQPPSSMWGWTVETSGVVRQVIQCDEVKDSPMKPSRPLSCLTIKAR